MLRIFFLKKWENELIWKRNSLNISIHIHMHIDNLESDNIILQTIIRTITMCTQRIHKYIMIINNLESGKT